MEKHLIFGVHLSNRVKQAQDVQDLFTSYGCNIKTRIGLHDTNATCSTGGVIVLEMHGDEAPCEELFSKLGAIEGVEVKKMQFGLP
jgi:hypothetical protein